MYNNKWFVVKKVDLNQLQQKQQITTNQFVVTLNPIKSMVYGVFQIFQQQADCCRGQGKTALTTKTTHSVGVLFVVAVVAAILLVFACQVRKSVFGVAAYMDIRPSTTSAWRIFFLRLVVYFFIFSCIIKFNVKNRS